MNRLLNTTYGAFALSVVHYYYIMQFAACQEFVGTVPDSR